MHQLINEQVQYILGLRSIMMPESEVFVVIGALISRFLCCSTSDWLVRHNQMATKIHVGSDYVWTFVLSKPYDSLVTFV